MNTLAMCCAVLVLSACATQTLTERASDSKVAPGLSAAATLEATYASLRSTGGVVYKLEPSDSSVHMYAFRAGQARQFGHNHVLSAPHFLGYAFVANSSGGASRFDLEIRLDELEIDIPEERSMLGESFATRLSPEQVGSTREHMLGAFGLQADQFPLVRIRSVQILGEAPKYAAQISLELHGQQRVMQVPLTVRATPSSLQVDGALVLLQSDFGVKPYSVMGGLLAVQDPVVVEFQLHGVALEP